MKTKGLVFETALSMRTEPADLVLADTSRFGSNGAFAGAGQPNWVREPSGLWVLDFNPSNPDYVEITPTPIQMNFTSGDFSIIARVYLDTIATQNSLFSRGLTNADGYDWLVDTSGRLILYTSQAAANQASYTAIGEIAAGSWLTLGLSRNGTSGRVYKNGADVTATFGTHLNPLTSARTVKIGIYDNKTSFPFDGKIAYLAVWNYALSAGQHLKKHYELTRLVG